MDNNFNRGYIIALISAAILSTTAIFIRHLTDTYDLPALILAFWRDLMVTVTLLVVLALLRPRLLKISRGQLPYLLGYGFILATFNSMWTLSVDLNGAAISTVLVYSSAGFTVLLEWLLMNERLDWVKSLAVGFSLAGCVLVSEALDFNAWQANVAGILTGISSGLLYAAYSLMGRTTAKQHINPWTTILYIFGFATIVLLGFNLLPTSPLPGSAANMNEMGWLGDAWGGWMILFILAAGPTLLGYGLYNVSLQYLPASIANLILTLEPVFTILLAYTLFNEHLSRNQLLGSLLIMVGVVFPRMYENRLFSWRQPAEQHP